MHEQLIKLMNMALMIGEKSEYVLYLTVLSGVGVNVHISRKCGSGSEYHHQPIKVLWHVDAYPELLQAALDAAEAILAGTFTGEGSTHDSETAGQCCS